MRWIMRLLRGGRGGPRRPEREHIQRVSAEQDHLERLAHLRGIIDIYDRKGTPRGTSG